MKRNGIGFLTLVMRRSPVRVRSLAPYFAPDSSDSGAFVCYKSGEETLFLHLLHKSGMDNFRKWFGDWRNAPAHTSKAVNADGTAKVVNHGSQMTFNTSTITFPETQAYPGMGLRNEPGKPLTGWRSNKKNNWTNKSWRA